MTRILQRRTKMTSAKKLRTKVVDTAKKYIGAKQGSKKHKYLMDLFNEVKPDGWAMTYDAYWCAAFTSAVTIKAMGKADAKKYFPLSANCGNMIERAKKLKCWEEKDNYKKLKAGDWLLYDWDDTGLGDNTGDPDHVGIVEKVTKSTITVIEGNRLLQGGRQVARRTMPVNGRFIRGFVVPDYEAVAKAKNDRATKKRRKKIADTAIDLAYPDRPKSAKYPGGKPTKAYKKALKENYPDRSSWSTAPRNGASCDVFVGTVIRETGIDPKFPRGLSDQWKHLKKSKKFSEVKNAKVKDLKDGDIITYKKPNGRGHICIYADGKIRHAAYKKWYPVTTNNEKSMLKKTGRLWVKVYRAK